MKKILYGLVIGALMIVLGLVLHVDFSWIGISISYKFFIVLFFVYILSFVLCIFLLPSYTFLLIFNYIIFLISCFLFPYLFFLKGLIICFLYLLLFIKNIFLLFLINFYYFKYFNHFWRSLFKRGSKRNVSLYMKKIIVVGTLLILNVILDFLVVFLVFKPILNIYFF